MASGAELGTITTDIPARLDRLPWARFHWLVVIGLGTVWILDGLEVTIVGSMSEALKPPDTGLGLSSFGVGIGAALMVAGGVVEILLGVKAEQQTLESIARPLTAEDSAGEARPAGATA